MLLVIDGAVGSCFLLTLPFGLAGYLYAGEGTDGNILQNADHHADWMFFLGRLGCGITIMLAMAMILLPCRASLLELVDVFVNGPHLVPVEEETLLVANESKAATNKSKRPTLMDNQVIHYAATIGIASTCYLAAIRVPGVAVVWSVCGSSLAFLIAFILPPPAISRFNALIQRTRVKAGSGSRGYCWLLLLYLPSRVLLKASHSSCSLVNTASQCPDRQCPMNGETNLLLVITGVPCIAWIYCIYEDRQSLK